MDLRLCICERRRRRCRSQCGCGSSFVHIGCSAVGDASSCLFMLGSSPVHILRKSDEIYKENIMFENAQIEVPGGGGD